MKNEPKRRNLRLICNPQRHGGNWCIIITYVTANNIKIHALNISGLCKSTCKYGNTSFKDSYSQLQMIHCNRSFPNSYHILHKRRYTRLPGRKAWSCGGFSKV